MIYYFDTLHFIWNSTSYFRLLQFWFWTFLSFFSIVIKNYNFLFRILYGNAKPPAFSIVHQILKGYCFARKSKYAVDVKRFGLNKNEFKICIELLWLYCVCDVKRILREFTNFNSMLNFMSVKTEQKWKRFYFPLF